MLKAKIVLMSLETDRKYNFIENTWFAECLHVYNMAFQLVFLRQNLKVMK